jgi:hypothetical protein
MSKLAGLLDDLQRPLEAMAWRAVQVYYGQSSSAISPEAAAQALAEINRDRTQQLQAVDAEAHRRFLLCGVDLDAWDQADRADSTQP